MTNSILQVPVLAEKNVQSYFVKRQVLTKHVYMSAQETGINLLLFMHVYSLHAR